MQTYTHAAIGGTVGALLFPHDPIAQGFCIVGSILSDVPYATGMALRSKFLKGAVSDATHSLLIAVVAMALAVVMGQFWFGIMAVAMIVHLVVDVMVHADVRMRSPGYVWPLDIKLSEYFGVWEYRRFGASGVGGFIPKMPEIIILFTCAAVYLLA